MSPSIAIRPAVSDADYAAALRVAHVANNASSPIAYYQAIRMALPRRRDSTRWVLTEDDAIVASLVAYPLTFRHGDILRQGYGLGSVATHPDHQRRGHARRLCAEVCAANERAGRPIGLLFSAIPPALYLGLDFQLVDAWKLVATDLHALAGSAAPALLVPFEPTPKLAEIAALKAKHTHGLHLIFSPDSWETNLAQNTLNGFFWVGADRRGYVRVHCEDNELGITEWAVAIQDVAPVLAALADMGRTLGAETLWGWMHPSGVPAGLFRDDGRAKTQPMVRGHTDLLGAHFWDAEYF